MTALLSIADARRDILRQIDDDRARQNLHAGGRQHDWFKLVDVAIRGRVSGAVDALILVDVAIRSQATGGPVPMRDEQSIREDIERT